jgi:hypothetical protein
MPNQSMGRWTSVGFYYFGDETYGGVKTLEITYGDVSFGDKTYGDDSSLYPIMF